MSTAPVVRPRHVLACAHNSSSTKLESWFIWTWRKESPTAKTRVPYTCNSWRCPVCARHEAAVTFARIKEAAKPLAPDGWVYIVLTLDRDGYYSGKAWSDVREAYKRLGAQSERFLKRLRRWLSARGYVAFKRQWVAVVEAHRSGWPHMNLMIHCPDLARLLRESADSRKRLGMTDRESILLAGDLKAHAIEAGWGPQSTAEACRGDVDALTGYVTKLAGLHDASVGEVAKITQAPMVANARFRRLRSGKGFLPPRRSNPAFTGCLVRRRRSREGDWEVQRLNPPKDESQRGAVELAACLELRLIFSEENALARARGRPVGFPPVQCAVGDRLLNERDGPPLEDWRLVGFEVEGNGPEDRAQSLCNEREHNSPRAASVGDSM